MIIYKWVVSFFIHSICNIISFYIMLNCYYWIYDRHSGGVIHLIVRPIASFLRYHIRLVCAINDQFRFIIYISLFFFFFFASMIFNYSESNKQWVNQLKCSTLQPYWARLYSETSRTLLERINVIRLVGHYISVLANIIVVGEKVIFFHWRYNFAVDNKIESMSIYNCNRYARWVKFENCWKIEWGVNSMNPANIINESASFSYSNNNKKNDIHVLKNLLSSRWNADVILELDKIFAWNLTHSLNSLYYQTSLHISLK